MSDGETVHSEQVELAVPNVVNVAKDLVEVVVHGEVASVPFVVTSGGKTVDLSDGTIGFGSVTSVGFALRPRA